MSGREEELLNMFYKHYLNKGSESSFNRRANKLTSVDKYRI